MALHFTHSKATSVQWPARRPVTWSCPSFSDWLRPGCPARSRSCPASPGRALLSPALPPSFLVLPHIFLEVALQSSPSFNLPFSLSCLSFLLSLYHRPTEHICYSFMLFMVCLPSKIYVSWRQRFSSVYYYWIPSTYNEAGSMQTLGELMFDKLRNYCWTHCKYAA